MRNVLNPATTAKLRTVRLTIIYKMDPNYHTQSSKGGGKGSQMGQPTAHQYRTQGIKHASIRRSTIGAASLPPSTSLETMKTKMKSLDDASKYFMGAWLVIFQRQCTIPFNFNYQDIRFSSFSCGQRPNLCYISLQLNSLLWSNETGYLPIPIWMVRQTSTTPL